MAIENTEIQGQKSLWQVCTERARTGSQVGQRSDNAHVALVIEGGGMRGVVSGGMVAELERLGWGDCFDSIHGSSAGACAAAYFTARQASVGTRIYYEDISNKKFINALRLNKIMNTSFLINHVMQKIKPLDVETIMDRSPLLKIVCTDANTVNAIEFDKFYSSEHFFQILSGTITIPIIAGKAVDTGKYKLFDGGINQQIPLVSALNCNPTHILVLLTRKHGQFERPINSYMGRLERLAVRLLAGNAISNALKNRNEIINKVIQTVNQGVGPNGEQIEVFARPKTSSNVNRLTKDTGLLKQAEKEAREVVFDFIRNE